MGNTPEKIIAKSIPEMGFHRHILVVGGGADNTLIELIRNKKCDHLTHIDISEVLSRKAKLRLENSRLSNKIKTDFIVKDFLSMGSDLQFDALVFPFYLDLFENSEIEENIAKVKKILKENGAVYVIDFSSSTQSNLWQKIKERGLYTLFFPVTKTTRKTFPDYKQLFEKWGFKETHSSTFKNGFYKFLKFTRSSAAKLL